MATIQTAISLRDNVSNTFNKIQANAQKTQQRFADLEKQFKATGNTSVTTAAKMQSALGKTRLTASMQNDINAFNDKWGKLKSNLSSFKANPFGPIQTGLIKTQMRVGILQGGFKSLVKTKFTNLKTGISGFFSTLTQGNKGLTGFKTALQSIGKISVVKLSQGFSKLKTTLTSSGGFVTSFGNKLKQLGSISLSKLKTGIAGIGKGLMSATKMLGSFVAKAAVGLAAAGAAAGAGIFKLTDMASDLSETQNKVDVAFGDSSKVVTDWAKTSITKMGLARQTALDTAALFGDMGTSMGIPQAEAAKMSTNMTQLAADLASFKNIGIDQATTALNGVFTGETESLKTLGIVMTQTNLDAYAMANGFGKTTDQMTEAEKVNLRYQYVLAKTANAQGDFERTGGGFANQLRMLKEQFKEIGTNIGNIFLPSMTKGLQVMNKFGTELNTIFADGWQDGDMDKVVNVINQMIDKGVQALSSGIPKLISIAVPLVNQLASSLLSALPSVATALVNGIQQIISGILSVIQTNMSQISNGLVQVLMSIAQLILTCLPQFITTGIQLILSIAQGIAQQLPNLIPLVVQGIVDLAISLIGMIPQLIQVGLQLIMGLTQGLINSLPLILQAGMQAIPMLIQGIVSMLPQIIQAGIQLVTMLTQTLIQNLPLLIQAAVQIVVALAVGLIQAIPQLVAAVPQMVSAIIDTIMNTDWLKVGWDIVKGIGSGFMDGIKGLFSGGEQAGTQTNQGVTNGINATSYMPTNAATNTATMATNSYSAMANTSQYGVTANTNLANGITSTSSVVTSAANNTATMTDNELMRVSNTAQYGANATTNLASGIASNTGTAVSAATDLSSQVEQAGKSDIDITVNTNTGAFNNATAQVNKLNAVVNKIATNITKLVDNSTKKTTVLITSAMNKFVAVISKGSTNSLSLVKSLATSITSTFKSVNLYETGANIMTGLQNGMESKRASLIATATSMANSIKTAVDDAMDINSPSRVMFKSGGYTGQGLINGIQDKFKSLQKTMSNVTMAIKKPIDNMDIEVPPETAKYVSNNSSSKNYTTNNFTIDMRDMQNIIKSDADINSIVEKLVNRLEEELDSSVEGVFA